MEQKKKIARTFFLRNRTIKNLRCPGQWVKEELLYLPTYTYLFTVTFVSNSISIYTLYTAVM